VSLNFVWLAGFVGAGLVFAGVTDFCGMGLLMARMPWNRR
jgi:predicted branched-subunit amino acid permease